jgi:DNA polymerase-3 subunit delta'
MTAPAPRDNALLVGHEAAERRILDALGGGRLPHAWLITGSDGVGKATLAYRFARMLLGGTGSPIGTSGGGTSGGGTSGGGTSGGGLDMDPAHPVFRRVAAGTHADLLTIEREWDDKKKRLKKNIAADSVREIPGFLHLTAAEGGWRVVIVDGAEDMSIASANALLKVLEEPPPRAVLMLVCATPGRLLPTIRSRCRMLALAPLAPPDMARVLAAYLPEMAPDERAALANLAEGSPGRALALAAQGGLAIAAMVAEVVAALPHFPLLRGYDMADGLRDEMAFEMFFALLRQAIAGAVTAQLRGVADEAQGRLAGVRGAKEWGAVWSRIGEIQHETEWHNLDKRQAVVTALGLLG